MSSIPRAHDVTADEALRRLVSGNERFVRGEARFPTVQKEILAELAKEQHPYATILGCSDSRVPPELVFDTGLGELFVVRVAGNVFCGEVAGTLQYAGIHLGTPLIVVLGHSGCGALAQRTNPVSVCSWRACFRRSTVSTRRFHSTRRWRWQWSTTFGCRRRGSPAKAAAEANTLAKVGSAVPACR